MPKRINSKEHYFLESIQTNRSMFLESILNHLDQRLLTAEQLELIKEHISWTHKTPKKKKGKKHRRCDVEVEFGGLSVDWDPLWAVVIQSHPVTEEVGEFIKETLFHREEMMKIMMEEKLLHGYLDIWKKDEKFKIWMAQGIEKCFAQVDIDGFCLRMALVGKIVKGLDVEAIDSVSNGLWDVIGDQKERKSFCSRKDWESYLEIFLHEIPNTSSTIRILFYVLYAWETKRFPAKGRNVDWNHYFEEANPYKNTQAIVYRLFLQKISQCDPGIVQNVHPDLLITFGKRKQPSEEPRKRRKTT